MSLSGGTVRAALAAVGALGKQMQTLDELAAGADAALRQAPPGLTPQGAAAFLATCAVESAWFRTTAEYGGAKARYAPYFGRGFVQLTWQANYAAFGKWCRARGLVTDPDVFVRSPATLADPRWAWLTAIFYFEVHNLWRWGNRGDFLAVSQAVNGGVGRVGTSFRPNGQAERDKAYRAFLAAGTALLPTTSTAATPTGPAEPPALPPKEDPVNHILPPGNHQLRLICPVGKTSIVTARAWISTVVAGNRPGRVRYFFQDDARGLSDVTKDIPTADGRSGRAWAELPDGTTIVTVQAELPEGGSVLLETLPKR